MLQSPAAVEQPGVALPLRSASKVLVVIVDYFTAYAIASYFGLALATALKRRLADLRGKLHQVPDSFLLDFVGNSVLLNHAKMRPVVK